MSPRAERPLRICHLAKYYPPAPGGIETHVRTLARAQAALGAEVEVLCVNHADAAGEDVTGRVAAVTPTVVSRDGAVTVTRLGRRASVARLDVCPGLPRALRARRHVDVLHLHTPNATMMAGLAAVPGLPLHVVTHHSDVIRQKVLGLALRPLEAWTYHRARLVLSDSPGYGGGSRLLQRHADKVRVLPLGLDLSPFARPSAAALAEAAALRARCGEPLWLSVGRLVYYKGLGTALAALAKVPGHLVIVGTGPLRGGLEAEARRLGVEGRVTFAGAVSPEALAGAYQAATALWFPSNARSEGFGLVQVEAMASGCPVVNTRVPHSGVAWVSRDGESGLTVPMDDPAALAAAARRLLEEDGLRARLAEGARARARREFDQGLMGERSLALYATLAPGAAPAPVAVASEAAGD